MSAQDTDMVTQDPADAAAGEGQPVVVARAVAFYLDGQRYALPIERVNEIQQIVAFTETPSGMSSVVGMVNLRGQVIPAVDMRRVVGLAPQEYTLETPMIITETHGQTVALIVDEVQDVLELPPGSLQDAPPLHALSSKLIGVCRMPDGLINVVDIDLLLGLDRLGGR